MAGNAYIMTAYNAEIETVGVGNIDYVYTQTGWLTVTDAAVDVQSAQAFLDSVFTIEQLRVAQGDFQQKYPDRDVRMERATVAITYPAV